MSDTAFVRSMTTVTIGDDALPRNSSTKYLSDFVRPTLYSMPGRPEDLVRFELSLHSGCWSASASLAASSFRRWRAYSVHPKSSGGFPFHLPCVSHKLDSVWRQSAKQSRASSFALSRLPMNAAMKAPFSNPRLSSAAVAQTAKSACVASVRAVRCPRCVALGSRRPERSQDERPYKLELSPEL